MRTKQQVARIVWGDGGHHLDVWWESPLYVWALYHVPTGEVLDMGEVRWQYQGIRDGLAAAARFGLQLEQAAGLR